jgi:hypothetical protein
LALSEDNAMPAPTEKQLAALNRLWNVANGHSGQCRYVAAFLLGLYNFRCLDAEIFRDCLEVLVMDFTPWREVHDLLCVPGADFERLATDWRLAEVAA